MDKYTNTTMATSFNYSIAAHNATLRFTATINLQIVKNSIPGRIIIITDENVVARAAKELGNIIEHYPVIVLPPGEQKKNIHTLSYIIDQLIAFNCDRKTNILAVGGGVIGDIAGLAAGLYMRGIVWHFIPTTLLAQVDAAIGGKTAINYSGQKNILGLFYPPKITWLTNVVLSSLPAREYNSAFAEIIKYALLADADFFTWLEENVQQLLHRDHIALAYAIRKSAEIKVCIVTSDGLDQGKRRELNLGHTFAHAIEVLTGFTKYLHGEAVAIGIAMAARLSVQQGFLQQQQYMRIINLLKQFGFKTKSGLDLSLLGKIMLRDKKAYNGKIALVLLQDIGKAKIVINKEINVLEST